ncbi:MAG: ABC transporter permease subunit [Oscillospiraceae bacterium]|jgi:NitT/TauT family transport system permease protein|nr:ABC transporter permease subunit [Oscillospiraceae bacterium]
MKNKQTALKYKLPISAAALLFWLGVWAFLAWRVGQELLLPTPLQVWQSLCGLAQAAKFWQTLGLTLSRILAGCAIGMGLGVLLGFLTGVSHVLDIFLRPLVAVAQSTPVASLIILALVWLRKESVPVFAAALMTAPGLLHNTRQGIAETPRELREMVRIFCVKPGKQLRMLYLPQVLPYVLSGCAGAIGFGWKAGVAAEVLSVPRQAVGTELYHSKLYLDSPALFAWTAAVVILSVLLEAAVKLALRQIRGKKGEEGRND